MDGTDHELFRSEAIAARRAPQFGEPLLPSPFTHSIAALTALTCLAAGFALVTQLHVPRRATVQGFIAPDRGVLTIRAPQAATLASLPVREGDRVTLGQTLAILATSHGTQRERDLNSAQVQRYDSQRSALADQRRFDRAAAEIERDRVQTRARAMALEAAQRDAQLLAALERAKLAAARVAELRPLAASGLIPRHQLLQLEEHALDTRITAHALQGDAVALRRDLATLEMELRTLGVRAAQRASENDLATTRLAQDRTDAEARREFVLRAPATGIVTALTVHEGATLGPAQPLLTLLPEGARLEARLLVPSREAGLLQAGQPVVLRLDAFPYQRFGMQRGRIRSVAHSIQMPGETEGPLKLDTPAFTVMVALDAEAVNAYGRAWPLRPGLLLEADIILERMPLYRRLLDPLRAFGRLGT